MMISLIVIDDFLQDPHQFRNAALRLNYPVPEKPMPYPGRDSDSPLLIEGFDAAIADIVRERLEPTKGLRNGYFRIALDGDKGTAGVHIDIAHWTTILYLTLPDDCPDGAAAGTHLFRHNATGSDHSPYNEQELAAMGFSTVQEFMDQVVNADTNDRDKWTELTSVPMRFNRLLIFRPQQYHDAGIGFGTSREDGRLIYVNSYNNVNARRM
jgi:hypothetical protein